MQWYYGQDGKQLGPVTAETLRELLAAGTLAPAALVWREGMSDWLPASQVGELGAQPGPAGGTVVPAPPPGQVQTWAEQTVERRRPWPLTLLSLYYLVGGGFFLLVAAVVPSFAPSGVDPGLLKLIIGLASALGALLAVTAVGVWRLDGWGRVLAILLAVLSLVNFPAGTIVGALLLVYLFSGGVVQLFSSRPVAELTPTERQQLAGVGDSGLGIAVGVVLLLSVGLSVVIAPIAAIAVPNLLNAIQRGKQKRTMGDIRTVAKAVESYQVSEGAYPDVNGTVEDLRSFLEPTYLLALPATDAWDSQLLYDIDEEGTGYRISSLGKDGIPSGPAEGATTHFAHDIVLATGQFVAYPSGTQI